MNQNQTLKLFQENQSKVSSKWRKLRDFVDACRNAGIKLDPIVNEKLEKLSSEIAENGKLKVALVGGFSTGKTSIAAAWLGEVKENMKIREEESSDEVVTYEYGDDVEIVDTPGLWGYKEKISDQGKVMKYKEITKKYVSEAHIILYVMESVNPIKASQEEDLIWLFKELNLLPRTIFVLSRFDDVADVDDEEEYENLREVKEKNVKSRLKDVLNLQDSVLENIPIVAVSANPGEKGTEYWLKNKEEFVRLSHINDLQDSTKKLIEDSGKNTLVLKQLQSVALDVMSCLPDIKKYKELTISNANEQSQSLQAVKNELENVKNEAVVSQDNITKFILQHFDELLNELQGIDEWDTLQFFYSKKVRILNVEVRSKIAEETRNTADAIMTLNSKMIEMGDRMQNNWAKVGKDLLNNVKNSEMFATKNLKNIVNVSYSELTWWDGTKKFFNYTDSLKEKKAKKVEAVATLATLAVGLVLEFVDQKNQEKAFDQLQKEKDKLREHLVDCRDNFLNYVSSKNFFNQLFPEIQKHEQALKGYEKIPKVEELEPKLDELVRLEEVIDVEFREVL